MNIFYLDHDSILCAQYHNDKHLVKMVLETAQLLCTAQRLGGNTDKLLYKPTHANHPSCVWARHNRANYRWLYSLFLALLQEYTSRYGKKHKCSSLIDLLRKPPRSIKAGEFTMPTQAMPDKYKHHCSIVAYRQYYMGDKRALAKWTRRQQPYWWK